jgi:hypothetical protein
VLIVAAGVSVAAVVVVAALLVAGVIGGGGDSVGSADEIAQKVADAIRQPGKVYHAGGTDGSIVWIDAEAQQYRERDAAVNGQLTSVGSGWTRISYDAQNNEVTADDTSPQGSQRPRIDDPMVRWSDSLAALAFSNSLTVLGRSTAEGVEVIVLQATTPTVDSSGNPTGTLYGRVEVDAQTYLPHAFESKRVLADGTTPTPAVEGLNPRVVYTTEFVDRSSLSGDFFDRSIVEEQIKTNQSVMEQIRQMGLTPAWFGQYYDGKPYGELQLPPTLAVGVSADTVGGEIDYALVSPTSQAEGAVVIRLAQDAGTFKHPNVPQFAGELPEKKESVTLSNGEAGTLYTSSLTVDALPCPTASCPHSTAVLYRRLIFQRGSTAIQLEVSPRILEDGSDSNGFNSRDGILSLAGALVDVPADISVATPTPGG